MTGCGLRGDGAGSFAGDGNFAGGLRGEGLALRGVGFVGDGSFAGDGRLDGDDSCFTGDGRSTGGASSCSNAPRNERGGEDCGSSARCGDEVGEGGKGEPR